MAAVRQIVDRTAPPPGVKAYVTGAAPLASDMQHSGNNSILKITVLVTVVIIFTVLLLVYRSIVTVIVLLLMVGVELAAARGVVAFLGHTDVLVLSTFAVNMLVFLTIAAGTDYGIFFFGRYQEARQAGEDRETAYYSMYRSVVPCRLGVWSDDRRRDLLSELHPSARTSTPWRIPMRHWHARLGRGRGDARFRREWPSPVDLDCSTPSERSRVRQLARDRHGGRPLARAHPRRVTGARTARSATLPGYKTSYNDRAYIPDDIPANQGYAAAERHFSQARLMPDILLVEADHDMRNPADFLVLNKLAKAVFKVQVFPVCRA